MALFISCDWGTSNFRLRLVDSGNRQVLGEIESPQGIAAMFGEWKDSGADRIPFYQNFLHRQIERLPQQLQIQDLPLIVSGMASSSIGMLELPYQPVPFGATGEDLIHTEIPAFGDLMHRILLVSGVRTATDVMRGEETQLIGCLSPGDKGERIYIFPGTHSKHVRVKDGHALDFTTYMTGEFFQLLSTKSILAGSVASPVAQTSLPPSFKPLPPAFKKGVEDSRQSGLLHNAFLVRTNQLFGAWSKEENYYYLSGLLIGEELRYLVAEAGAPTSSTRAHASLTIVSTGRIQEYYATALPASGPYRYRDDRRKSGFDQWAL